MEIEFANEQLALIETPEAAETELPVMVIQSARQRLNVIRAAPDVQTLQSWMRIPMIPTRYSEMMPTT